MMASDSVVADAALLPETVQVPESDEEVTSLAAASAVSVGESESAASASDAATPELLEFRRKKSEALEQLRALYRLPEAEGTFADIALDLMGESAKSEGSSSSTTKSVKFVDGSDDEKKAEPSVDLEDILEDIEDKKAREAAEKLDAGKAAAFLYTRRRR